MDERAEPPGAAYGAGSDVDGAPGDVEGAGEVDRLEVLEHQVRQLTSRLAGWVEAQLVQSLEDRRNDMKALRTELQVVLNEQLAGIRAESASILSVATRRLELAQEQLGERLDAVAARAHGAPAATDAERADVDAQLTEIAERHRAELDALRTEMQTALAELPQRSARIIPTPDGLEQRVRSAMSRLSESVEAKLAEVTAARRGEIEDLRDLIDAAARQAATAAEGVQAFRADPDVGAPALEALEQRIRSAMGRLSGSVDTRLDDLAGARKSELDALRADIHKALAQQATELRTDVTTASSAMRARAGQVQERVEALEEQQRQADERFGTLVEEKLAEVVERRKAELDAMKWELQEALAKQLGEAKAEIGTSVSDAHRRFVEAVDRLDERTGLLDETVKSNGTRIESLEMHTRRTDDRLTDLVDAKLAELVDRRVAELEEKVSVQVRDARAEIGTVVAEAHRRFLDSVERLDDRMGAVAGDFTSTRAAVGALEDHTRRTDARLTELVDAKLSELATERIAELDEFRGQLRNALDAHLEETRADVTAAVGRGREELAAGAARLARLEDLLIDARERLREAVEVKLAEVDDSIEAELAELDGVAEGVARAQDEMAAVAASADQTAAEARDELQAGLKALGAQVDAIAAATAKAAFAEEGALAPVRSDVRMLQVQVAELAKALAELRPRPKAPAGPSKAEERARALAVKRAAVGRPEPAKARKAVPAAKGAPAKKKAPGRRPAAQ